MKTNPAGEGQRPQRHRSALRSGAATLAAFLLAGTAALAATPPNVLLILTDDQGYPDLGCIGTKPVLTPHLDRLAAEGVRATNFYVTWPACTPSRGSLLTGRYPQRNGLYDMVRNDLVNYGHRFTAAEYAVSPEMTLGLDPRESTIGDVLKRAGYRTGVVGKWDMGQARRFLPLQRGFDFFYGHGNNGIDYYTHERYGVPSMFRGNERTEADKGTYATDLFKREALRFLSESRTAPWFLYLAFNAPHSASSFAAAEPATNARGKKATRPPGEGVQVPDKYAALYRGKVQSEALARYYGAVTCMDEAIGEILALLRQRGDADNTLVFFLSDNGGNGNGGNAPLRGAKGTMFEGGLRVPFLAWWPGRLPAGRVNDEFLTSLEILPTLAQVAGAQLDARITLDGFDLLPVLRGERKSSRTEMFWQRRGDQAARVDQWKWVRSEKGSGLFDLTADPGETHDLATTRPDVAQRLEARFLAWRAAMDATEPRGPFRDY
jgi:arylsulfatase A-like enzyme